MRTNEIKNKAIEYKRGQILVIDLGTKEENRGSEQWGVRPCVIVQNDVGNKFSPTLIIAPITSQQSKRPLPTHVALNSDKYRLDLDSVILAEQIKVADKSRVKSYMGELDDIDLNRMNRGILVSMGLAS